MLFLNRTFSTEDLSSEAPASDMTDEQRQPPDTFRGEWLGRIYTAASNQMADWDSPSAIKVRASRPPNGSTSPGLRKVAPTWEKIS